MEVKIRLELLVWSAEVLASHMVIIDALQVVTLEWEEGKDEQQIQLCDIQSDGRGRLKWEAVERAFGAANVELALGGPPSLCQGTQRKGLTKGLFKPGSTIPVVVFGKEQGMGILLLCFPRIFMRKMADIILCWQVAL